MEPGEGMGQGFSRIGGGGFEYCRCSLCGYTEEHRREIPCRRIRCPKCGSLMVGN